MIRHGEHHDNRYEDGDEYTGVAALDYIDWVDVNSGDALVTERGPVRTSAPWAGEEGEGKEDGAMISALPLRDRTRRR